MRFVASLEALAAHAVLQHSMLASDAPVSATAPHIPAPCAALIDLANGQTPSQQYEAGMGAIVSACELLVLQHGIDDGIVMMCRANLVPPPHLSRLAMDQWSMRAAFQTACADGCLAAAQWLTDRFGLAHINTRVAGGYALFRACAGGHIEIAIWLTGRFRLNAADASARGHRTPIAACTNGHLAVLQWLIGRFDFGYMAGALAHTARGAGQTHVVQWLTEHFDIADMMDQE